MREKLSLLPGMIFSSLTCRKQHPPPLGEELYIIPPGLDMAPRREAESKVPTPV